MVVLAKSRALGQLCMLFETKKFNKSFIFSILNIRENIFHSRNGKKICPVVRENIHNKFISKVWRNSFALSIILIFRIVYFEDTKPQAQLFCNFFVQEYFLHEKTNVHSTRSRPPKYMTRSYPVDTGRKLSVHKTFRRRPERLLNVLCTFNLRPMSTGQEYAQSQLMLKQTYRCGVKMILFSS